MVRSPYWLPLLPAVFWGSNVVVAGAVIPAVLPFGLPHLIRQWAIVRRHWRILTLLALLGITGFNLFVYIALQTTSAINTALVQGCLPVAVIVVSWLVHREGISWRAASGMALAFAGVLIVVTDGDFSQLLTLEIRPGDLVNVSAMWIWGAYVVLLSRRPLDLHPLAFLLVIILIGDTGTALIYLSGIAGPYGFEVTLPRLGAIFYIALFPSVLAFHLWSRAITALGPNVAGQFQYLIPVFGMLFAVILLGEPLHLHHIVAIVVVLIGVWLASRTTQSRTGQATEAAPTRPTDEIEG
jgi:drug/metabolite transporter (DMT)-like permease